MGVREDGKLGVYGDVAVDRSGSGMEKVVEILVEINPEYQMKKMQRLVNL